MAADFITRLMTAAQTTPETDVEKKPSRFAKIKRKMKERKPELIALGVFVFSVGAYVFVKQKTLKAILEDETIQILNGGDDGFVLLSKDAVDRLLKGMLGVCFVLDEDHHFTLVESGCDKGHD